MIKKNTVIITGAGANNDYGFPTGQELTTLVCDIYLSLYKKHITPNDIQIPGGNNWDDAPSDLRAAEFEPIQRYLHTLKTAGYQIDRFIGMHKLGNKFEKWAKHSIILTLIENEHKNNVQQKWLEVLYQQMINGVNGQSGYEKLKNNNITFITFNYDRVIERFFIQRTMDSYGIDEETAFDAVKNIKVTHVFGQIANLPFDIEPTMQYGGNGKLPLGNISWELINNIDLIRENRSVTDLKSYNDIQNILKSAERLYILGYGFNNYNNNVLNFPNSIKNVKEIFVTKKGTIDSRIGMIFNRIFKNQAEHNKHIVSHKCESLLQDYYLDEQA